jgi:thiamine-monophosphate kinase
MVNESQDTKSAVPSGPPADFTEVDLVAAIRRILSGEPSEVVLGPGDDAALVEPGIHVGILTADMLVEGVHFERDSIAPRELGYKAVAVNVSDIAAMGGSPRYGLVSLGLPADVGTHWVVELYGGLREAATEYAMSLVGGDTSRAGQIVVSVALTGEVARSRAVTRSGARPGDRIVVTGALGGAAGGLRLAQTPSHDVSRILGSAWGRELLGAHVRPTARVGEGQGLAQAGATAMIDISDGLASDLARVCRESGVSAAVTLASIPVAEGLEELGRAIDGVDPLNLALNGGEDYELLATLPPEAVGPAGQKLHARFGTPLTEIGEIRPGEGLVAIEADGSERPLTPEGWDHFAS